MTRLKSETEVVKRTINVPIELDKKIKENPSLSHLLRYTDKVNHCLFLAIRQLETEQAADSAGEPQK